MALKTLLAYEGQPNVIPLGVGSQKYSRTTNISFDVSSFSRDCKLTTTTTATNDVNANRSAVFFPQNLGLWSCLLWLLKLKFEIRWETHLQIEICLSCSFKSLVRFPALSVRCKNVYFFLFVISKSFRHNKLWILRASLMFFDVILRVKAIFMWSRGS